MLRGSIIFRDYVVGDGNDSLLSQDFNWEEHKPPVVPETENHDSSCNNLVDDFKVPKGRIPISNFKSRLEIQGLMHPDDWMNKSKKRRKAKETKGVTSKGEPHDIATLIKNKHQLMYGDDFQPSQALEPNQNSQHLPALNSVDYGAGVARDSLTVNGTDMNTTSNLTRFNETPFMNLSHNYSSRPLMALPLNLGYNSSGPSMYPCFPSITSGLSEGTMEVLHSTEWKAKNDSTVFGSLISNDYYTPDGGPRSSFVCQRNEVSGAFIPLNLDGLEDFPSNGSHSCHPDTFQHLSGVHGSFNNRGLVSLDDCDQIFKNDSSIANNLSAWGDQERMQNPLEDITNYDDRELDKAGLEPLHNGRQDWTNSKNHCQTSFMPGSYSPVLGSSIHLTKRKRYSRSVKSALNAMKENIVSYCNDNSSHIHGESNSLSRTLNPSSSRCFAKSPIQLENTLRKVSFNDDHEVESYLQKNGDAKDSCNYFPATFDEQQTCRSPDLFASQDPLFYNYERDIFVKDDANELFSNSHSGNTHTTRVHQTTRATSVFLAIRQLSKEVM
ncbi:uncharacterized protein [Macrobrachium rosenbergii]|uniref:uncharacterized protein isoform X2 n=1 Tax=Macrobrachium rosenbergii TaxID=79674 RepID=UPI0034D5F8E7